MKIMDTLVVRLVLAALLAFKAFDDFFATALTLVYKMNVTGAAESLGRLTAGDDYSRFVPLMEAVPVWLHGLWVLAGILYMVAIVLVVGGFGRAHIPVLAALALEIVANVAGRPIIETTGVVVNPNPSVIITVVIPYLLPLFLALALSRQTPASKATAR